jgi:hypothetical protein
MEARDDVMIEHVLRVHGGEVEDLPTVVCLLAAGHGHLPLLQRFFSPDSYLPLWTLLAAAWQGRLDVVDVLGTGSYCDAIYHTISGIVLTHWPNMRNIGLHQIIWGLVISTLESAGRWDAITQIRAKKDIGTPVWAQAGKAVAISCPSFARHISKMEGVRPHPSYCPEWLAIPRSEEERIVELGKYWNDFLGISSSYAEDVFQEAVNSQLFGVAKWIDARSNLEYQAKIVLALGASCNTPFFEWWLARHPPPPDDMDHRLLLLAIGGSVKVDRMKEFLRDTRYAWLDLSVIGLGALRQCHFDVARLLFEQTPLLFRDTHLTSSAASSGNVRALAWLRELNPPCPLNDDELKHARTGGKWSIVHWLLDHETLVAPGERHSYEAWCKEQILWQWRDVEREKQRRKRWLILGYVLSLVFAIAIIVFWILPLELV